MAYKHTNSKGVTYTLHKTDIKLMNGEKQTIYFFTNKDDISDRYKDCEACDLPDDREVVEDSCYGYLTLRKIKQEQ